MPYKPFFGDEGSEYFDAKGRPIKPGQYEFHRYDGRRIVYTLAFMEVEGAEEEGDAGKAAPPKLKVIRAGRLEDFPNPPHALHLLDGEWVRYLGGGSADADGDAAERTRPEGEDDGG